MINIAIVEDNKTDSSALLDFLERRFSETGKPYCARVYESAMTLLENKLKYDIIFMDIELPIVNGMEASRRIRQFDKNVIIIFVTNLAQFALEGYEVNAFDFVVKPITYYNFSIKLNRAVELLERNGGVKVEARTKQGIFYLDAADIKYVEIADHSLIYHTSDKNIVATGHLYEVESVLEKAGFARCNRCYLVNLKYVKTVRDNIICISGGDELLISRNRKKEFLESLADYLCGGGA